MGGTSGQTPATTTQTKDPWSGAQPYISNALSSAQNMYNANVGYQPYTGQMIADPNQYQTQGLASQIGIGQSMEAGLPGVPAAQQTASDIISQQGITPGIQGAIGGIQGVVGNTGAQNPDLQAAIDAQNRIGADRVNSAMSGAGRYGSAMHTDALARAQAEVADPLVAQDYANRQQLALQGNQAIAGIYGQGLNQTGQFSQLLPQLGQAQFANQLGGAQAVQGAGQFYSNLTQQQLNASIQQYQQQQAYPWEQLARFNAIIGGTGGLGGTSLTQQTPYQPSTLQRALGGALAGGGLGSAFGPMGAGVGALGGGAAGAFL